jgi:outer membrane protein OmpA-like peptidoglycan-associated protein
MSLRSLLSLLLLVAAHNAYADATVPTADLPGAADPAGLGRYAGALIVDHKVKAYDEIVLPISALERVGDDQVDRNNNALYAGKQQLALEGKLSRVVYVLPEGRSPLEVLRNYQQLVAEKGGRNLYECKADTCGGNVASGATHGGSEQGVINYVFPADQISTESFSNAACAVDSGLADLRYGVTTFTAAGTEVHVAVLAFTLKDDLYCKALDGRTIAIVATLEAKAREQNMVTVKASELARTIADSGKIALYGIHFDFDKADIKPESAPQLDEIAAMLRADGALRLMVVGHTDNQGAAAYNLDLSKRRADAVVAALTGRYGIAADRLLAQGMGSASPLASNDGEAGRAKNRRVELVKQ